MIKVTNFIKNHYKTIVKVSFVLFLLYYIIYFLTPKVQMTVDQKQKIDSLNILINKMNEDNKNLEYKIDEFQSQIIDIDNNIDKIKGQKTIVKEIYHEKINNVDKLSISELDSFFANRYK